MSNWETIHNEFKEHKDEIVLSLGETYRFVGINLDLDEIQDDYYYILKDYYGKEIQHSCVMGLIYLKPFLPEIDYNNLNQLFLLNNRGEKNDSE
jgi:hypothetical protein